MRGGTIRRYALVALAVLATASMFPSFDGSSGDRQPIVPTERARYSGTDCGTFSSASIYPTARVTALRGVTCARALAVAKAYDASGRQLGKWRCALSHGGGNDLFSCGKGGRRGNLRKWPHALVAKGEGPPSASALLSGGESG
jgi:hypothetical protein